jgi:hypothetical protein
MRHPNFKIIQMLARLSLLSGVHIICIGYNPCMLMVIFGAGASFDSSPTYVEGIAPPGASTDDQNNFYHRPPLAKELFANRPLFIEAIDLFPQCKTVVPRLRDPAVISGQRSIETILQEIEQEALTYPRGLQELAAIQCYLQRAINSCQIRWHNTTRGITNYLTLLREIERTQEVKEPVCLVTFNYDTLLEYALDAFGIKFERMEDYTDSLALFRVFKLHGSVNWGQIVENEIPANMNLQYSPSVLNYLIEHAAELRISNKFVLWNPVATGVVDGKPVFPAIAIPVEKKNQFACPQILVEQLVQVLRDVSKILVVGWRATEQNFLNLLANRLTGLRRGVQLHIVAGSEADASETRVRIYRALINNPPNSPYDSPDSSYHSGGFTDFLASGRAKSFLES